jgi:hypothetical protein
MSYRTQNEYKIMKNVLSALLMAICALVQAQTDLFLHIKSTFAGQPLQLQTNVPTLNGQVVNIDHFNYYLSDLVLYHDGGNTTLVSPTVMVFTPDVQGYYLGNYSVQQLDSIRFMVGVPPRFNTQQGAEAQDISSFPLSHPLSFQSPSMYWGWQFGYMHMVVGGNADSDNNQQTDAYFEFHNLGDHNQRLVQMPIIATQTTMEQQDVYLECRLDQWLHNMPLGTVGVLHGETGLNDSIMANVNTFSVFTQPQSAGLIEGKPMKFYTHENTVFIENMGVERMEVYDVMGRKIQEVKWMDSQVKAPLEVKDGVYTLTLYGPNNSLIGSRRCRITQP